MQVPSDLKTYIGGMLYGIVAGVLLASAVWAMLT